VSVSISAALAEDGHVILSAGRKGQCWDNALAESFCLTQRRADRHPAVAYPGPACRAVVECIAWYNGTRLHSTLGYRGPTKFEKDHHETIRNVA
jgi:transposase InsO family protein